MKKDRQLVILLAALLVSDFLSSCLLRASFYVHDPCGH